MKAGRYGLCHYQLTTFHIRPILSLGRRIEIEIGLIDLLSKQQSFPIDLLSP